MITPAVSSESNIEAQNQLSAAKLPSADINAVEAGHDATRASSSEKYPEPTEEELQVLRKVPERLPWVSFSLCLVELAERASYYGAKTVFSNFIQFPLPKGPVSGTYLGGCCC